VADKIVEIASGDSWRLRYPVGADAEALIAWRARITDEAFVAFGGGDDAAYAAWAKNELGLDLAL
jgi:hypothetical protein